jgi:methylamine dehydrogenase accessory protein MauD
MAFAGHDVQVLVATLFLLWMIVILLIVAVMALARQVRALQDGGPAGRSRPVPSTRAGIAPVVSAPTLAGDMLTIGGPSADGRAQLLLFIRPACTASRTAVRDALALTDRKRLRLLFVADGRVEDYGDMLRQHRIRDTDIIVNPAIGADFRVVERPAAALVDPRGRLLARGGIGTRAQLETLLAQVERSEAAQERTMAVAPVLS